MGLEFSRRHSRKLIYAMEAHITASRNTLFLLSIKLRIRHIVLRWLMWQLLMNYSRLARTEAWRTTLTEWSERKQMKTKNYLIRFRQAQVALMEIQARTSVPECVFVCDEQMWWKLRDGIVKSETKLRTRTTCHKREQYQNSSKLLNSYFGHPRIASDSKRLYEYCEFRLSVFL